MKHIQLTQGKQAMVDDEDYTWLNQWKWQYNKGGYATRKENGRSIYLHRAIMGIYHRGVQVDHINGDKLLNTKDNLRFCNQSSNNANSKQRCDNTSGFRGVSWSTEKKKWEARVAFNGKRHRLGRFTSKIMAAQAYNAKAHELFGEFARLNEV